MRKLLPKLVFIITFILMVMLFTSKVYAMTIVLDPGHGGEDTGAMNGDLIEKDMTMKIAKYMESYLNEYEDLNVILTHNGSKMSLQDRADFTRNCQADLLFSIHINSSRSPFKKGAEAYVTYRTELPKYNEEMTQLANEALNNISKLGITNNGVKTKIAENSNNDPEYKYFDDSNGDYYGIIRRAMKGGNVQDLGDDFSDGSGVPTVLMEHAYLSNSQDIDFLNSDEKLKALAKADVDAIVSFYNLKKNTSIDIKKYLFNTDINKNDLKVVYNKALDYFITFGINVSQN